MFKRVGGVLLVEGLDTSKPAEYISESASPNNMNMMVSRAELRKRPGHSALGSSMGERVFGGVEFYREATPYILRMGKTMIDLLADSAWSNIYGEVESPSSSPSSSPSPSPSPSAAPAPSPFSWDPLDSAIVSFATPLLSGKPILTFTNFTDPIKKYDGTTLSDLGGSPPLAKFILEYESYLLLFYVNDGSTLRTMRAQWCDTAAPETWTGGNSGAKDLISDEDITGAHRYGNFIAVHKPSSIWLGYLVSSTAVFRFDMVATGRGTIAHNTVKNLPTGEQIYLCREGLALFNGNSAPLINSPMLDDLRDGINPEYAHQAWGVVMPHLYEYWLGVAIGGQTAPETIFAYNYKTGTCHRHLVPNTTYGWLYSKTSDETFANDTQPWDTDTTAWDDITSESLSKGLMVGTSEGETLEYDVLVHSDGDEAIDAYWESKDFTHEDPSMLVNWGASPQGHGSMELWAKGNSVTVSYSTDGGETWKQMETVTLNAYYPADDSPIKLWFKVLSTRLRVRFRNNTLGQTFFIKQFMIHGKLRERR